MRAHVRAGVFVLNLGTADYTLPLKLENLCEGRLVRDSNSGTTEIQYNLDPGRLTAETLGTQLLKW